MKRQTAAPRPLPGLTSRKPRHHRHAPGVLFAVYAPFGTDPVLTGFPDETLRPIDQHPLLAHLKNVAAEGVNVAALIDLVDDDSWLVEIPAWRPERAMVVSAWKQAMSRPQALAGFLKRAHARFPCGDLVLALEGHGAGFLPEVDLLRVNAKTTNDPAAGPVVWVTGRGASRVLKDDGSPTLPVGGFELLPVGGFELLPTDSPEALPAALPMSTWALAQALADAQCAGVPKPAVIHFNNCFNMALEHLHTVAPYAHVATGYANYNYFTCGSTYPQVFKRLRQKGAASALTLARWFATENHRPLKAKGNHPGVGAAMVLGDVEKLAKAVNVLADKMTAALVADRATHFPLIQGAIADALQFDTQGDFQLDVPDQSTDLGTWAARLMQRYPAGEIHDAAKGVLKWLKLAQVYGDKDSPRMAMGEIWDFSDKRVAVSILLPDPQANGLLDWRAPYYMKGAVDPATPPSLKAQIPFLASLPDGSLAPWPRFLREFHNVTPLPAIRLLRIPPFRFPIFDIKFKPDPDNTPGQSGPYGPNGPSGDPGQSGPKGGRGRRR
jgi:hypothetical protein